MSNVVVVSSDSIFCDVSDYQKRIQIGKDIFKVCLTNKLDDSYLIKHGIAVVKNDKVLDDIEVDSDSKIFIKEFNNNLTIIVSTEDGDVEMYVMDMLKDTELDNQLVNRLDF
jgi:hypothetical protein